MKPNKIGSAGLFALGWAVLLCPRSASANKDNGALVRGDFDGDGTLETVASEPTHDDVRGRVYIVDSQGVVFELHRGLAGVLGSSSPWQRFGSSLAVGDFDGDGYDDLAVGAPTASDATTKAGSVHVFYGSSAGLSLSGDQLWHQDSIGIVGVAEQDDYFGESLEAGDFDCDGYDDLAIGVPSEDLSGKTDTGVVHVLYGSSSGITTTNNEWYQGYNGIGGTNEAGDRFGEALAAGNFNGDTAGGIACNDLAIGVPFEDAGALTDAGVVYVVDGGTAGLSTTSSLTIDQDVPGVADDVEAWDYFGKRLAVADLDGDAYADLVVTVLGDACGGNGGDGRHTFSGSSAGLSANELTCDLFGCSHDSGRYGCVANHPAVHASNQADVIRFMFGADIAFGYNGDDEIIGSVGPDVLFGNADDDTLDGGPGPDILLGGFGDDSFTIDLDCDIEAGDIVDGGIGNDTIYSHLSQTELTAAGLLIRDIENFVTIAEHPFTEGPGGCQAYPFTTREFLPAAVTLSWDDVPTPSTTYVTATGLLDLTLTNPRTDPLDVEVTAKLTVLGYVSVLTYAPVWVAAQGSAPLTIDLNGFIPAGEDPEQIPDALRDLPTSAVLIVSGQALSGTNVIDTAYAPRLYGHLDVVTDEAIVYGEEAKKTTYNNGDLQHLGQTVAGVSGTMKVYGSRGPLP